MVYMTTSADLQRGNKSFIGSILLVLFCFFYYSAYITLLVSVPVMYQYLSNPFNLPTISTLYLTYHILPYLQNKVSDE